MWMMERGDEECFRDNLVNENIDEQYSGNQAVPRECGGFFPRGTVFFYRFEKQSGTPGCLSAIRDV